MNKYKIAREVDIFKSSSAMGIPAIPANLDKVGALAIPFVGVPIAAALVLNDLANKNIHEIACLEELNSFSCVDEEWKRGCIYVEHEIFELRYAEADEEPFESEKGRISDYSNWPLSEIPFCLRRRRHPKTRPLFL